MWEYGGEQVWLNPRSVSAPVMPKNGESTEGQVAKASKAAAGLSQSYMLFSYVRMACLQDSEWSITLGPLHCKVLLQLLWLVVFFFFFGEPFQGAHCDQRSRSWSHCPQDRRGSYQQAGIVYYGQTACCVFS